ncbi:class I SAM-dependent methyltransferase [Aquisphaera insulae]|uniref:class I SAM-dependent methyltransferase n=1 Tax=Aquisphaera insulae TaxID=2712864 RepID=UPI0013EC5AE6|nr:class I SAM-dependent methyltransferase [Aquisphaera insulae]
MTTLDVTADAPLENLVDAIYRNRFGKQDLARRSAVWKVLCEDWFEAYIPRDGRVLEVAAGYCEFINNVRAAEKVAVDLNPETRHHAAPGVAVHRIAAESLNEVVPASHFDAAFMSNFLEHCRTREQVLAVFSAVRRSLRPGGRILILGPNIAACAAEYFDYFDHHLALTDRAVAEALELSGFHVEVQRPRTLPFSFRSKLPSAPWLVRLYLKFPIAWRFFGAQFFLVARREERPEDQG